jgi:hypothetical protein
VPPPPSVVAVASKSVVEDIGGRQRRRAGSREGAFHRDLNPPAAGAPDLVAKTQTRKSSPSLRGVGRDPISSAAVNRLREILISKGGYHVTNTETDLSRAST